MSNVWAAKNPDKWRKYKRKWQAENRDKQAVYRRNWNERNPNYYADNKDCIAKRASDYWNSRKHDLVERELLRAAKRRAKDRGVEFSITLEDVVVPDICPLLGVPLRKCDLRAGPNSPSLDRKNNNLGYIKGNVWVISRRANIAKSDLSLGELELLVANLRHTLLEGAQP